MEPWSNYAEWRGIEREFRELCREQPMMRATETPDGWVGDRHTAGA
jgi:hypothetical protein